MEEGSAATHGEVVGGPLASSLYTVHICTLYIYIYTLYTSLLVSSPLERGETRSARERRRCKLIRLVYWEKAAAMCSSIYSSEIQPPPTIRTTSTVDCFCRRCYAPCKNQFFFFRLYFPFRDYRYSPSRIVVVFVIVEETMSSIYTYI